jgi:hypothetical protein
MSLESTFKLEFNMLQNIIMSGEVKKKGKFGAKGKGKKDQDLNGGSLDALQGNCTFGTYFFKIIYLVNIPSLLQAGKFK